MSDARTFDRIWVRSRLSYPERLARLRSKAWHIGQCSVAAGLAWFLAHDLLGHPRPFFAPIVAVICLGTSDGQRLRRVAEVTVGVAVGVFLADLLLLLIGTGGWQVAALVALSMTVTLMLNAGTLFVTQAAAQGIVVVTLAATPCYALTRWLDALVGGAVPSSRQPWSLVRHCAARASRPRSSYAGSPTCSAQPPTSPRTGTSSGGWRSAPRRAARSG